MTQLIDRCREVASNGEAGTLVAVSPAPNVPETRGDAFTRLCEKRTSKLLEDIRLLGNLSNPHNYDYTDEQVDKLVEAVLSGAVTLERQFREGAAARRA